MSLRKSPVMTSAALAANRRNAQDSTGPRTAAGKARARRNAFKHGRYVASDVSRQTMLALGEDPEEFENLYQNLLRAYEPADPLWAKQVEDLAKLYWRRGRLERARDALLRQRMFQSQLEQEERLVEIERATFPDTEDRMVEVLQPSLRDPVARLRLALSYWQLIRRQVARGYFHRRHEHLLMWSVGEVQSWRRCRIKDLLWQLTPHERIQKGPPEENAQQRLVELLDEEIAELQAGFEKALRESEKVSPEPPDVLLAPLSEQWESLGRQENHIQRAIDRKTRILLAFMRTRARKRTPNRHGRRVHRQAAERGSAAASDRAPEKRN
jgi:hypothetical protein